MTKSKTKVTIVTPSYNQGEFIEETILSVLNQTYDNIQYIIVDGGSTDNTMEIVNKYKDRIDIIISEKDKGQSDAINKGFKLAEGELAGWINSDDILYPHCVEKIVELYEKHPDGSIYYGSMNTIIGSDSLKERICKKIIPSRDYLLSKCYDLIQPGSFYNNKLLKEINYVDESIYYAMDLDLWLRLSKDGRIYRVDNNPLAAFRIWEGTKTTNGKDKFLKSIREVLLKNGASYLSKNIRRTYWYQFKYFLKLNLIQKRTI